MRWTLCGLGVAMILGGFLLYRNTAAFVARSETAVGRVDSYASEQTTDSNGKRKTMHYPVVAFTARDGSQHTFRGEMGTSSPGRSGERVEVLYDPKSPSEARTKGFFSLWLGPLVCGGMGAVLVLVGLSSGRA